MPYMLRQPRSFSFKNTVLSHGWCDLSPFRLDEEPYRLSYVLDRADGGGAHVVSLSECRDETAIEVYDGNGSIAKKEVLAIAAHILRLDEDLEEFYDLVSGDPGLGWIKECGAGRMLRSPTVFEDLVKTICTTNCSWGLTKKMVGNLVEKLGNVAGGGRRSFPCAAAMAERNADFYRNEIKAGYRAEYLAELAVRVDSGELDPESWLDSRLSTKELKKEILGVKGVGPYAAENLLKLLGRYDGLALDSFLRSSFYRKHRGGTKCTDKDIESHYEKYGCWRGLVMWCEMSENWLE